MRILGFRALSGMIILLSLGCSGPTGSQNSWHIAASEQWAADQGLQNVEAVLFDEVMGVLYATNGKDYQPGTDGFISKLSSDGGMLSLRWIDSLNRPTGMAMLGSVLFVADVNALVSIDTRTGTITERFKEQVAGSGLNDVTIDEDGSVYVSASAIHAVYKLEEGQLSLWAQDEERLAWANGLESIANQIMVAGMTLSSINRNTGEIMEITMSPAVKDFEGIVREPSGGFFLTTVENSALYFLSREGVVTKLANGSDYLGDFDFVEQPANLYLASGRRSPTEFAIISLQLKYGQ